mgnify:CR=1 FL=1
MFKCDICNKKINGKLWVLASAEFKKMDIDGRQIYEYDNHALHICGHCLYKEALRAAKDSQ